MKNEYFALMVPLLSLSAIFLTFNNELFSNQKTEKFQVQK